MAEFVTPTFLQNHSPEEIHARMKEIMPKDLDLREGGHASRNQRSHADVDRHESCGKQQLDLVDHADRAGRFRDL